MLHVSIVAVILYLPSELPSRTRTQPKDVVRKNANASFLGLSGADSFHDNASHAYIKLMWPLKVFVVLLNSVDQRYINDLIRLD